MLGVKGHLYVALAMLGALAGVPHAHIYDWIWVLIGVLQSVMNTWRAAVGLPDNPGTVTTSVTTQTQPAPQDTPPIHHDKA